MELGEVRTSLNVRRGRETGDETGDDAAAGDGDRGEGDVRDDDDREGTAATESCEGALGQHRARLDARKWNRRPKCTHGLQFPRPKTGPMGCVPSPHESAASVTARGAALATAGTCSSSARLVSSSTKPSCRKSPKHGGGMFLGRGSGPRHPILTFRPTATA